MLPERFARLGVTAGRPGLLLSDCRYTVRHGNRRQARRETKESRMNWMLILLIIVVIVVFGLGFVVKWLFWIALALFLVWIITLLVDHLRRR